jgi:hypothetical protein
MASSPLDVNAIHWPVEKFFHTEQRGVDELVVGQVWRDKNVPERELCQNCIASA